MNLFEDLFQGIFEIIFQTILLGSLRAIGASIKWLIRWGKKPFVEILEEDWNGRLGLLIVALAVALGIWLGT